MSELREVIISITNRCNIRCRMCDIPANKKVELPTALWKDVISDASLLRAQTVVFSGGEPLLREDLFDLIAYVKNNRMQACITSNGSLLDGRRASQLASSGVDVVNISVEGPREIHDHLRGKGSFEKALLALENLKKHKIESTLAAVVSNYNYRYLPEIVELAKGHGVTTIKLQPFSGIFLGRNKKTEEFFVPPECAEELRSAINEAARRCGSHGISTNPRGYLERIPLYLSDGPGRPQNACPALLSSCPIDASGEVYPCWVVSGRENRIGNVTQESLSRLWGSARRAAIIERITRRGCPGCMMSCYDDNFGKASLDSRIAVNLGKLRREGPLGYSIRMLKRWKKRVDFYMAYRGSPRVLFGRFRKLVVHKDPGCWREGLKAVNEALEELKRAKRMLQDEIGGHK